MFKKKSLLALFQCGISALAPIVFLAFMAVYSLPVAFLVRVAVDDGNGEVRRGFGLYLCYAEQAVRVGPAKGSPSAGVPYPKAERTILSGGLYGGAVAAHEDAAPRHGERGPADVSPVDGGLSGLTIYVVRLSLPARGSPGSAG